jgi:hypothetical protein
MDQQTPSTSFIADEQFLITWLSERDAECPLCKYNLRRLTSARCPECGEALQLGVSLVEPYLKAWIAVVVALLPPAGLGVLFAVIFTIEFLHYGRNSMGRISFWDAMGFLYIIGCIPLSIAILALRRRFQRLQRTTQNLLACIAWLVMLVALVSFIAQIR